MHLRKDMREVVLKKGNRGFLDLFWDITSSEIEKRDAAIKNLQKHLSVRRNDIREHLSYSLDRLSKGLRSSARSSKAGFSSALTSILQDNKDISAETLFSSLDKNVLSFKAHDAKELVATNLAKIDCLVILYKSGRLDDLKKEDHKKIAAALAPLAKIESCLQSMLSVVSQVVPHLDHKVITLYRDLISQLWNSAWKAEEPTAGQILFILSLQDHSHVMSVVQDARKLETGNKSVIKRIVNAVKSCFQASDHEIAAELVARFRSSPIFSKLWARLSTPIDRPETPISQRLRTLRMGLILLSKLQTDEQFKVVVTPTFLAFLQKQLSNAKLSSHEDICREVNSLLSHFRTHVSEENSTLENNDDCRFSLPNESAIQASHLFTSIASQMPLFDATLASRTPHLLSSLLDCSSVALSEEYLYEWSRNLQKLFLTAKEDSTITTATVDRQRLHILELLRLVVFLIISRSNTTDSLEFLCETLDFLLLVANSSIVPLEVAEVAITSAVAGASLTQLGKCLTLLIRRVSLRAEMRNSSQSAKVCKQTMRVLVNTMRHLVETNMKICSDGLEDGAELLERLGTAKAILGDDNSDAVEQWIGILYATTIIYAVTLHSDPPSPKEASVLSLLDDISEARRHRSLPITTASNAMDTSQGTPASTDSDSTPEWSAVLTDAMLSLCVEPWRLLREVVGATFGRVVAQRELFAPPLGPPEVVFGTGKKEAEEQSEEAMSPLQLILSIADSRSKAAQERIAVAGVEEDEDDPDESIDGSSSAEEEEEREIGKSICGFADLEEEGPSTEAKIEDEEEEEEFLSNEQMEEQDEALAALFRASRSSKMDAKSRKEAVALLKLSLTLVGLSPTFDPFSVQVIRFPGVPSALYLGCKSLSGELAAKSSFDLEFKNGEFDIPTLYTTIQLAVASTRRTSNIQTQRRQGNKGDHVPLARIASCLDQLRSRPLLANELLWQSICNSDEALLPTCFKAIFRVFRNAIPDNKLIKCLQTACEFLQFKKVADQNSRKLLNVALEDVLGEFLSKMHPSKAHQLLLTRLITSSPELAELTGCLVIERLKFTLQPPASPSQSNLSYIYAQTALLSLANAVTSGLAGSKSPALSDWVLPLSRTLIGSFFMNPGASTWTQSKALTVAVFECLFNCFKLNKTVFDQLTSEELTSILTSNRTAFPKAVRPHHSRLIQLIRSLRASSQHLSAVLEGLDTQRKLEKAEAKQERRRKRKAKAAADLAKKKKAKLEGAAEQKKA
ncbi:Myb-binding protein [Echinococcus granulosus]|uniref:Myb-binding protein n=1 Tax=Echinococcus granulosus TaxID=6210 RepID=W6UB70_ECHGR|nr:Myb-binding protein [Echinococcus granulosus]EUB58633.1 Myb-binding protein [Echinococcus granulosus]